MGGSGCHTNEIFDLLGYYAAYWYIVTFRDNLPQERTDSLTRNVGKYLAVLYYLILEYGTDIISRNVAK